MSLSYLIRELDRSEFEPHVYCPRGPAADLFERAGATIHIGRVGGFTHIWASTYRGRRWLLFIRELLRLPEHAIRFRATLRKHRFGLVHLNDSPLIPAAWLARRAGVPIVWHLRSALPEQGTDRRSRLVREAIRRFATESIAITEDVANVFGVGSAVIPNSVDLDGFRPAASDRAKEALGLPPGLPVLAYFGFLYPFKGFREFILAADALRRRGVHASYLIVGGAVRGEEFFHTLVGRVIRFFGLARNYDREAQELVAELDLESVVRFVPFTPDTSLLYQASDVVAAPSRGPELGRPVIEAAASGRAVVASGSSTGAGVVVPGRTGLVIGDLSVETLVDAVEDLLRDAERREQLGEAARAHAEENFDPVRNGRRVEQIYRKVLAPRPERVRVLFIHHRPQLGGAPSSLAELIRHLDPRFEPHVFVPEGPAAELFERAGAVVHTGPISIFAHVWDSPYEGLRWALVGREAANLPAHVVRLAALMGRYRFPIVHLNDSPLLPAAQVARSRGARVVWHLRSALAGEGRDGRSRLITGAIERWGDAAIAIDPDVAARFPIRLPLTIIHNSVSFPDELPRSADAKRALGLPADRVAVGFAGFVRRQKGWRELVAAAEILVREGIPVHFVVMGGGVRPSSYFRTVRGRVLEATGVLTDEESAIKGVVREKGLDDAFSFLPFTSAPGEVYGALDIVTFPNQGIGLGRPVLEAAAYGKPVVASGSGEGGRVLVPDVTGILLEQGTPEAIAGAIRRLASDEALRQRLGKAAAAHARNAFDPDQNARKVEAIYDELLGIAPVLPEEPTSPEPVEVPARS